MYDMKKAYTTIADKVSGIKDGIAGTYRSIKENPGKAAGVAVMAPGIALAADMMKPQAAQAVPFLNWSASQTVADYDAGSPGLESLFAYAGTNDSTGPGVNRVSRVDFGFGYNDGVFDADLDLEGWTWDITDDMTTFWNESGDSWNPGLFNEASFSLYGLSEFSGLGTVVGYNSLGDASNITDVTGPGAAPVPEPSTMLLLGTGIAGLAAMGRRKLKKE